MLTCSPFSIFKDVKLLSLILLVLTLIAAQRVKAEQLDLICIPTSFQVSCHFVQIYAKVIMQLYS